MKRHNNMIKLYFGNTVTTATTLMILALLGFIAYSAANRTAISAWGRRSVRCGSFPSAATTP